MSANNRKRFLAPWKDSPTKPALYHCISRVVDRRFVLNEDEREHFRKIMRLCEQFTGCRVLSYCLMSNHFHILLEVPPPPPNGIHDDELFHRLSAFYSEAQLAEIKNEMADALIIRPRAEFEMPRLDPTGAPLTPEREAEIARAQATRRLDEIRHRYTRRMHDLSEFMKSLLERFTKWFNRTHDRTGTLWEDRYKSVIVEDGTAARTIAAYIDLNPVRAGIVTDPAQYRWTSYGEAIGGGKKGNGKKAREGLVRACFGHQGTGFDSAKWHETSRIYRRLMGIALGKNQGKSEAKSPGLITQNTAEMLESGDNQTALPDLTFAAILLHRIRYFTDGAVIGSKAFVNEVFEATQHRFGPNRKDGARKLRGAAASANEQLWSMRDLRAGIQ